MSYNNVNDKISLNEMKNIIYRKIQDNKEKLSLQWKSPRGTKTKILYTWLLATRWIYYTYFFNILKHPIRNNQRNGNKIILDNLFIWNFINKIFI